MNRYFFIAPFYDLLKQIAFGDSLTEAVKTYIPSTQALRDVLIVGGGSGASLTAFQESQHIDYVESNSVMINKAKRRNTSAQVSFHKTTFETYKPNKQYDLICLPFYLDLYNQAEAEALLYKVQGLLKPNGRLIVTDFYPIEKLKSRRQKLLLRTVIVFFNITTWHRHTKIFNIINTLKSTNFQLVSLKECASGMVFASLWKNAEH